MSNVNVKALNTGSQWMRPREVWHGPYLADWRPDDLVIKLIHARTRTFHPIYAHLSFYDLPNLSHNTCTSNHTIPKLLEIQRTTGEICEMRQCQGWLWWQMSEERVLEVLLGLSRYLNNSRENIVARFMLSFSQQWPYPSDNACWIKAHKSMWCDMALDCDSQCAAHTFHCVTL